MNKINFNQLDGIIWDMDGVLIDVSQSYRMAILKTAQCFCDNEKISIKDVNEIKKVVGLNNDWDASFALILQKNNSLNPIDFVKKIAYFRKTKQYQKIKNVFQDFYLKKGLIDSERLLIAKSSLQKLKTKYQKMGIATGRQRMEAEYVLKKKNIKDLFDTIIAMEDCKKQKPSPEPLLRVKQKLNLKKTIYIGDSSNDVLAAQKAKIPSVYLGKGKLGTIQAKNINQLLEVLL